VSRATTTFLWQTGSNNAAAIAARDALSTARGYPKTPDFVGANAAAPHTIAKCCSVTLSGLGSDIYELDDVPRPAGLTRSGSSGDRLVDWLDGWPSAAGTPRRRFVVYGIFGQSNGKRSNDSNLNPLVDISDAWTMTQNAGGANDPVDLLLRAANEPLPHPDPRTLEIAFAVALCRKHLCAYWDALGYDVMLVPKSTAGTGFSDNRWGVPGGVPQDLLADAVSSTTGVARALAVLPSSIFGGILWSLGEKDANAGMDANAFAAAFDATCTYIDGLFGTKPMVFLGMSPTWVTATGAAAIAIQAKLASVHSRRALSAYADPTGVDSAADIHYSCANHRGDELDVTASTSKAVWTALQGLL
jgi:hypothetical protein